MEPAEVKQLRHGATKEDESKEDTYGYERFKQASAPGR